MANATAVSVANTSIAGGASKGLEPSSPCGDRHVYSTALLNFRVLDKGNLGSRRAGQYFH